MVIHSTKDNARDIPINSDVLKEAFNTIIDNIDYEDFECCETENVVIRLWDEAKEILDRLGPEAALLHIYLTAQCLTNQNPFQDPFILNADDILKELGWDKRKRLKRHEKLLKLKQIAFALGSLYQTVRWRTQKRINGKNRLVDLSHEGLVWIIDFFSETQVRLFPEDPEEIIRLAISVKPGIWAEKFLNQKGYIKGTASNEYGYMSGLITQIDPYHDDLAFRIALFLTIENRINNDGDYYVKTLLKLKYSDDDLTEATKTNKSNRVLAKTIRNNWEQALARLHQLGYKIKALDNYPNWLRPDFLQDNVYQSDGKRRQNILTQLLKAKVQIFQPDPIPEKMALVSQRKEAYKQKVLPPGKPKAKIITPADIREARKRKGWSQRKLAGVLGISQALVAYYENGERKPTPETLRSLKKVLDLD